MNISEMDLDQASEAMLRISNAISFILEDEEVTTLLDDISESEKTSIMKWIPKYVPRIANVALKRHRENLYEIIGALSQKDRKQVGKIPFGEAVGLIRENWETLAGFFSSSEPSTLTNVITPC